MKHLSACLVCCAALAGAAAAQDLGSYLGPGVLTNGAGSVGSRSGEQVDLRYYADLNAVYDNGLEPVSTSPTGQITKIGGLYGVEAMLGAYGSHSWRSALLGLDYRGDFRHYNANSYYDGSDQNLTLGYTFQKSRRLYFDLQGLGGTYSNSLGSVPGELVSVPADSINQPGLLLFDNRTDFLQGFAGMTYLLSARASVTVGGDGFYVHRQSKELIGMDGYTGRARFQYKVSRLTSLGAEYQRSHYQYPNFFGNSDINNYNVFLASQLGRLWTFTISGGAFQVATVGITSVALDPSIAQILGVPSVLQAFSSNDWLPAGQADLSRRFKQANLSFQYARTMAPGNGVYLTSRSESGGGTFSYTGLRRASFSISGGYYSLSSLGQGLQPYRTFTGGTGLTFNLTHALHAVARYDVRQQEITIAGFRSTSYRITLGLAFSPGSLPLSLW